MLGACGRHLTGGHTLWLLGWHMWSWTNRRLCTSGATVSTSCCGVAGLPFRAGPILALPGCVLKTDVPHGHGFEPLGLRRIALARGSGLGFQAVWVGRGHGGILIRGLWVLWPACSLGCERGWLLGSVGGGWCVDIAGYEFIQRIISLGLPMLPLF